MAINLAPVRLVIAGTDKFSKMLSSADAGVKKFQQRTAKAGKIATATVTAPVIGIAAVSTKAAASFNSEMAKIQKLSVPISQVKAYKTEVQKLSMDFGMATNEMAEGLYNTISAFGQSNQTINQYTSIVKTAKAANIDVATSLKAISAGTKGFGDTSAEAMQKMSDLIFKTEELGQTSFAELGVAMQQAIPNAAALKMDMEEMFAVFATGTGIIGNSNEVATKFKALTSAMLKPTGDMKKAFKGLSGEQMIQQHGLKGTMMILKKYAKENGKAFAQMFASTEAFAAGNLIANQATKKYDTSLQELTRNISGMTDQAFRAATTGLNETKFAMDQMSASTEVAQQQIGDALAPELSKLIRDTILPLIKSFNALSPSTKKVIVRVALLAAAIGPLLLVMSSFASLVSTVIPAVQWLAKTKLFMATAVKVVTAAQWLFNAALTANPIGIVIVAIGALIDYIVYLTKKLGNVTDAFKFFGGVIIKSVLTPLNMTLWVLEKIIAGMAWISDSDALKKVADSMKQGREAVNLFLTGNKSLTQAGMIYDSVTQDRDTLREDIAKMGSMKHITEVIFKNETGQKAEVKNLKGDAKVKPDTGPNNPGIM